MRTSHKLLAVSLLCSGLIDVNGAGLVNGSFESPNVGSQGVWYTSAPTGFGWTLASGDMDLIGPGYWQPSDGAQSLDLNGFGPGTIYQDFSFASAGTWAIKFDLSGNFNPPGTKIVKVSFGLTSGPLSDLGTYSLDSSQNSPGNMHWQTITTPLVTVQDSALYRLQFTSLNPGAAGPALDNVRLEVVPEPAAIGLIGLGFVTGFLTRRSLRGLAVQR
jgi:hypothetical protein